MKVHEFIKILQEFEDQEADIFIIEHHDSNCGVYQQGGTIKEVEFNKGEHFEYTDFRGNPHVKPDASYFNARTLLIGARNL